MNDDLRFALELARRASEIALDFSTRSFDHEIKPDGSPVTEADLAIEKMLLYALSEERPDDAVLSEERGAIGDGTRRWLLDPLDGTSNFLAQTPGWGTLITLQVAGESSVGIVTRPLEDSVWWAVRSEGSFRGTLDPSTPWEKCSVSSAASLDDARVTAWHQGSRDLSRLEALPGWVPPSPESLRLFLQGDLDAIVSIGGCEWDHAPLVLLAEEAGGTFRDKEGGDRLDLFGGIYGRSSLVAELGRALTWF